MKLTKLLEVPVKLLKYLLGINMLFTLVLIFCNVILRTLGLTTIVWAEPLVIYLTMWTVFLGAGLVYSGDEHLQMGILYDLLPKRWQKLWNIINEVLIIGVSGFLIYFGTIVTKKLYTLGQTSMDGYIPIYMIMISIPIGAAITIYCLVTEAVKFRGKQPVEEG